MSHFSVFHPLPFTEGHLFLHDPSAFFPLASTAGEQDRSPVTVVLAQISTPPTHTSGGNLCSVSPAVLCPLTLLLTCLPSCSAKVTYQSAEEKQRTTDVSKK